MEHPFLYVKRIFGYSKMRYRGLAKNHDWLVLMPGFANLLRARALSGMIGHRISVFE